MIQPPSVAVLITDGINCDMEMSNAFEKAGATSELVHINQLSEGEKKLADFAILAIPGGFSYGDDIASGAVLGNELVTQLGDEIREFASAGKPVLGVCNGFQVLVRAGILPEGRLGEQTASLTQNEIGGFICKWIELEVGYTACEFVKDLPQQIETIPMQIAHGEGKFVIGRDGYRQLLDNRQIAFRYKTNPNGSINRIAGICDPSGLILGMMPHPERSISSFHPDRTRTAQAKSSAETIFRNIVNYARES